MKLTKARLDALILEVLQEKHEKHKNNYEREQYLRNQQKDAEERRQKKKEIRPDYDLMRLSKGILEENELLAEPSDDGYVRIKADALQRMLTENNEEIKNQCNRHRYFQLDQILDFISKLKQAEKGK